MKYSICIDALYQGVPIETALKKIKQAGFDTIEFWSWPGRDLDALEAGLQKFGFQVSCFCTDGWSLTNPSEWKEYLEGLKRTIPIAKRLGCKKLITQAGPEQPGISHLQALNNITEGLKRCVSILEKSDVTLMLEPLNLQVDHPGYSLAYCNEALEILEKIASPNVKMLFDIYHQQITEGNLLANIRQALPYIAHFHAAGISQRGELDDGEVNYAYLFQQIHQLGYQEYIGLEYRPTRENCGFDVLPKLSY